MAKPKYNPKKFYSELKQMAKRANQRMVRLEKAGIDSPAYQGVQARLEMLGRTETSKGGRRFSESGIATYNEMEVMKKFLNEFLGYQTSTVKGAKQYYTDVWESANKNQDLSEAGISREEWFDFWEEMPDNKKERIYGSEQIVSMVRAYKMKNGELTDENKMSMAEIAEEIQASRNLKDAYNKLGITAKEVINARPLKA